MTVSRYLHTPDKVSPKTAQRIAQVMAEVNYTPDERKEATQAPATRIGILVRSFNNQIFSDLLAGIESLTALNGYQKHWWSITTTIKRGKKNRSLACCPVTLLA